jgi:5-methylcytosine-specific restriction endonuclease McrA
MQEVKGGPVERLRQKRPRLALDPDEYGMLKKHVLDRDGWKCQHCGTSQNLQVHHVVPRSRLGPDELDNLISLAHAVTGNSIRGRPS